MSSVQRFAAPWLTGVEENEGFQSDTHAKTPLGITNMSYRNSVAWPIIELFDSELGLPAQSEPERQFDSTPTAAEAVFMAGCDVFLTREGTDVYMLTLKHRGKVSEIKLTAGVDDRGRPSLIAEVG